jgi:hypothetical protein
MLVHSWLQRPLPAQKLARLPLLHTLLQSAVQPAVLQQRQRNLAPVCRAEV